MSYFTESFRRDLNALKPEAERQLRAEGKCPPDEWAPLNGREWLHWEEAIEWRALRMLRGEDRRER